jgi:hypothetical protein
MIKPITWPRRLSRRMVDLVRRGHVETKRLHVVDHADDLVCYFGLRPVQNLFADRRLARKDALGKRLTIATFGDPCHRWVNAAVSIGRVAPNRPNFANEPQSFADARAAIRLLDDARQPLAVHKGGALRQSTADFAVRILKLIEGATSVD